MLGMLRITSELLSEIREGHKLESIVVGRVSIFRVGPDGVLRFQDRVCVPSVPELRRAILEEGHRSSLSIHPGATKMYQDPMQMFWWLGVIP